MKMRFIAIIISISLCITIFAIPVYAMSLEQYHQSSAMLLQDYFEGNITYDTYVTNSKTLSESYYGSNVDSNDIYSKIGNSLANTADKAGIFINAGVGYLPNQWNRFFKENELTDQMTPNYDLRGHGAMLIEKKYDSKGNHFRTIIHYTDIGYVNFDSSTGYYQNFTFKSVDSPNECYISYDNVGSPRWNTASSGIAANKGYEYEFIGNWIKKIDGTRLDEAKDVEFEIPDIDNASSDLFEDFLEWLLDELKDMFPDLSTIEGLLEAIYKQTKSINGKMITVDDLNNAILQLMQQNCQQEILQALLDIREYMKNPLDQDNSEMIDLLTDIRDLLNKEDEDTSADLLTEIRNLLLDYSTSLMADTNSLLGSILDEVTAKDNEAVEQLLTEMREYLKTLSEKEIDIPAAKETDLSDVVKLLEDIKEALENGAGSGTGDNDKDKKVIAGTLYNVIPLESGFWQKLFNGSKLRVMYQDEEYYLEQDGTLYYNGEYYYVDMNYVATIDWDDDTLDVVDILNGFNTDDLSDEKINEFNYTVNNETNNVFAGFALSSDTELSKPLKKVANAIVDVIVLLIGNCQFTSVTSAIITYQLIIFDPLSAPQDITFTFMENDYTFLSSSIITENQETVSIIRTFASIVITFMWLLNMRKKVASMID